MVLCIQEDQNVGLSAYFKTIITCLKEGNEFHYFFFIKQFFFSEA